MRSLAIRSQEFKDSELVAVEEEEDVAPMITPKRPMTRMIYSWMKLLTVKTKNRRE